jgi:hypothetical protein
MDVLRMTRWSALRALPARRRRLARHIEEQRAGDGAHLIALEHHERGRYCKKPAKRHKTASRRNVETYAKVT